MSQPMSQPMSTIHDARLEQRLSFIELDEPSQRAMRDLGSTIEVALASALDAFYDKVRQTPDIARLFHDERHIDHARGAQAKHWAGVLKGGFDGNYARRTTAIGLAHARIGLAPRWYIGGYGLLADKILKAVTAARWPLPRFGRERAVMERDRFATAIGAIVKTVMLDLDVAISVYIQAAEEARLKAQQEEQRQQEERDQAVAAISAAIARLSAQDLTARIAGPMPEAYQALQANFNAAVAQIEQTIGSLNESSHTINSGTSEIASAAADLSRRAETQAAAIEQTTAALGQVNDQIRESAAASQKMAAFMREAEADAQKSSEVVNATIAAINEIASSAQQIGSIIGLMEEITFQTNLLALNAGVEAARAGDVGRGFAVVAQEVRTLAQRSAAAAKDIEKLIQRSAMQVSAGVKSANEAGRSLQQIKGRIAEISEVSRSIAASTLEQSNGLGEVNQAMGEMDTTTQQNAAMAEQTTAACQSLRDQVVALNTLVEVFRIGEGRQGAPAQGNIADVQARLARAYPRGDIPRGRKPVPAPPGPARRAAARTDGEAWEDF